MEPETLHRAFRDMLLLRRFEEKASQLYGMGLIGGFCHLYIGQEAVVTGIQYALGPGDSVITGYRCHAHMLIAGVPSREVMAELTGRAARECPLEARACRPRVAFRFLRPRGRGAARGSPRTSGSAGRGPRRPRVRRPGGWWR